MKILYVHERFGSLAGAEANVFLVARQLAGRGHEIGILHGPGTGKGEDGWREVFSQRFELPAGEGAAGVTSQAISAFEPDAVFVHKMPDLGVLEELVQSGRPLARMVHDHDIYCMRSYKYNYFTRRICRRPASFYCVFPCMACAVRNPGGSLPLRWVSLRAKKREIALNHRFDRMCVVTEYMREELVRNGFDQERIEIHPPVPLPGQEGLRSNFSNRNLILYAGQIIRGKGVDVLLRSLAQVESDFECVILGDGSHRAKCEALRDELGLSQKVQFKGYVPQEELKAYYRECSVVALSSVWPEPIATIGLEVMRYALPVVAFDAGGIKDWLDDGENGYLVPWMDTRRFAESIDRLLCDKALAKKMGESGFRIVSERYDFDQYIEGIENLFATIAAERASAKTISPSGGAAV